MATAIESVVGTPFRLASSAEQNFFIIQGHVISALKFIPSDYVDCIVTSPPYWGLRDYGEETVAIWDAEEGCEHEWGKDIKAPSGEHHHGQGSSTLRGGNVSPEENWNKSTSGNKRESQFCQKCGAWRGQLGLEPSLDLYLSHLWQITDELYRVLKPSGVMFWNHGDSYNNSDKWTYQETGHSWDRSKELIPRGRRQGKEHSISQKCMCLQNYRFLLGLTDTDWRILVEWRAMGRTEGKLETMLQHPRIQAILRNQVIWNKPNHMPSSVKDRFTNSYEPIFMLTKNNDPQYYYNNKTGLMADRKPTTQIEGVDWDWKEVGIVDKNTFNVRVRDAETERFLVKATEEEKENYAKPKLKKVSHWHSLDYWFDLDAVREPFTAPLNRWGGNSVKIPEKTKWNDAREKERWQMSIRDRESRPNPSGKNPGNVWTIPTQPFPEAHFAVFPEALPERCIKCSCPTEICTECGKARVRITETVRDENNIPKEGWKKSYRGKVELNGSPQNRSVSELYKEALSKRKETIGWTVCNCKKEFRPGTVLDPFLGSGTTMKVARRLGVSCIGIEISQKYVEMAKKEVDWNKGLFGIEFHEIKV